MPLALRPRETMKKPSVGIVYHFFAHYRQAIICELIAHGRYHYMFLGDTRDPLRSGIESCRISKSRFIQTRSRFFGKFLVQAGIISLAARRDLDTIIYLGDAQFLTTWISAAYARLVGKHVLFWSHGWPRLENGIKDRIRCLFYRLADGMILYSNRSKAIGVSKGFDPRNLHVIYNSLDYDQQKKWRGKITQADIRRVRRELFRAFDRPLVICTGRLVKYRHLELLIGAMELLHKQGHPINLLLVGDGPEHLNLRESVLAKGLAESVAFYGACYRGHRLAELITAANVTVIPGRVGLTAMHSLAFGVPVISHDYPDDQGPEWEAIIPGVNGDLYRYGDVADLAKKIQLWTREELPNRQNRSACYDIIEKFYNPSYQRLIMDRAVAAEPAQDDAWEKWLPSVKQ